MNSSRTEQTKLETALGRPKGNLKTGFTLRGGAGGGAGGFCGPSGPRVLEGLGTPRPKKHCKIQVRSDVGAFCDSCGPLRVRVCSAEPSGRLYSVSLEECSDLERRRVPAHKVDAARRIPVRYAKAAAPRQSGMVSWHVTGRSLSG